MHSGIWVFPLSTLQRTYNGLKKRGFTERRGLLTVNVLVHTKAHSHSNCRQILPLTCTVWKRAMVKTTNKPTHTHTHTHTYTHTSCNAFEVECERLGSLPWKRQVGRWRLRRCRIMMLSLNWGQFRTDPQRSTVHTHTHTHTRTHTHTHTHLHFPSDDLRQKCKTLPQKNVRQGWIPNVESAALTSKESKKVYYTRFANCLQNFNQ